MTSVRKLQNLNSATGAGL